MAEAERTKKSSVTQLVHSTIGLGLLRPAETSVSPILLSSPEQEEGAMAMRAASQKSAGRGSVSSEKAAADHDSDGGLTSLDSGTRPARGRLPHQPSQDG